MGSFLLLKCQKNKRMNKISSSQKTSKLPDFSQNSIEFCEKSTILTKTGEANHSKKG